MAQFRFHERFRWPVDQVLLIGLGIVPPPVPVDNPVTLGGLPLPLPPARQGRPAGDGREQGSGGGRRRSRARRARARVYRGRY